MPERKNVGTRRQRILKPVSMSVIRQMAARVVRLFQPERVILFGSYARGKAGPDSDVDLLVVMDVATNKRDAVVEIAVALNEFPAPKDIFVSTPEEFEWRKQIIGTLERPANNEGKVLYARR